MRTKPDDRPVAAAPTVARSRTSHAHAPAGEVEGKAGTLDAGAHDDHVGCRVHRRILTRSPVRARNVAALCRRYLTRR